MGLRPFGPLKVPPRSRSDKEKPVTGGLTEPLVVVLGASGLVGTAVVRELSSRPVRLRLVGRRPMTVADGRRAKIEVRRADLAEPGAVAEAVAGADVVVHLVAHTAGSATWRVSSNDEIAERVNLGLVLDLIEAFRTRPAGGEPPIVLFAGSMSQCGKAGIDRIDESIPDFPLTTYDRHKMEAENALKAATADNVVRGVVLRLATLFGQGTDSATLDKGLVSTMIRRALAGLPLTMWHDGSVTRDLVCSDDVARAFVAAMDNADALVGRHWLVGTGHAVSVKELFDRIADTVAEVTGRPRVPVLRVAPPDHASPTDFLDFVLNPTAFQEASGWRATIRWDEALVRTVSAIASGASDT
jgi:nucleoside-diphosphate-sugar epimerase